MQTLGPSFLLAQSIDPQMSIAQWIFGGLSSFSALLGLLCGVGIFCGACKLVATGRRPAVLAAYLVLLPLPVLIVLCGQLKGIISSLTVMAAMPEVEVTNSDLAGAIANSLLQVLMAILVTAPTYFVLAVGLLKRTFSLPCDPVPAPVRAERIEPVVHPAGTPLKLSEA